MKPVIFREGKTWGELGKPRFITLHWTAGLWHQCFDHYHLNAAYDETADKAVLIQTLPLSRKGSHVRGRNSNNIGLTMCAKGVERDPKTGKVIRTHEPKASQLEMMAKTVAELQLLHNIPDDQVVDHAHWALLDGYHPTSRPITTTDTRYDIAELLPVIKRKAAWYKAKLLSGELHAEYTVSLR